MNVDLKPHPALASAELVHLTLQLEKDHELPATNLSASRDS